MASELTKSEAESRYNVREEIRLQRNAAVVASHPFCKLGCLVDPSLAAVLVRKSRIFDVREILRPSGKAFFHTA